MKIAAKIGLRSSAAKPAPRHTASPSRAPSWKTPGAAVSIDLIPQAIDPAKHLGYTHSPASSPTAAASP